MKTNIFQNFLGGLAGALALNLLHETVRRLDREAPRVDLAGQDSLNKIMDKVGAEPLEGKSLYTAALTGDVLSNALYYSTIGLGKDKWLLFRGAAYGYTAGLGAVKFTKKMRDDDKAITDTEKTKWMTIAYYAFGGLVTAYTIRALRPKK